MQEKLNTICLLLRVFAMARSRNIKPGLFKNEILGEADPIYSLMFAGLWTLADKEGRLEYRPKRIKAEIFPYRVKLDPCLALAWLNHESFITVYEIDQKKYIQINNWRRHQTPHHKEADSEIPPLTKGKKVNLYQEVTQDQAKHDLSLNQDQAKENASCPTDSLNLIPDSLNLIPRNNTPPPSRACECEEIPSDQKPDPPPKQNQDLPLPGSYGQSVIPDDFQPNDEALSFLRSRRVPEDFIDYQLIEFRMYWKNRGGGKGNWDTTFMNRCVGEWQRKGHNWNKNQTNASGFKQQNIDIAQQLLEENQS